jgi:putative redox protein
MVSQEPKAVVQIRGEELFEGITASGRSVIVDADADRSSAPSPMELLLIALGSCTGVDVVSILRKKRGEVVDYRIEVRGVRRTQHPRSYERIELNHIVRGRNISERSLAQAVQLSDEKYCSVAATFRPTAEIVSTYKIIEAGEGE